MSYETVMTAAKIIATAHPIARGVCKCDTPADVSFKDVASTLLDSGWESVLIADKNLLIANNDSQLEDNRRIPIKYIPEVYYGNKSIWKNPNFANT